jgi:non-ribosomal peptide synthetase component F
VLSQLSGRKDVVFGTVLFGRMRGGSGGDRVMGLFINTLPVRIKIGNEGVEASVRATHQLLGELLRHEHAALALAQRCSGVPAGTPLFSALLNYIHTTHASSSLPQKGLLELRAWEGMQWLHSEERTNYPFVLSVDDLGADFWLSAQVRSGIDPKQVCELMESALESLVKALETSPETPVFRLTAVPEQERHDLMANQALV